MGKNYQNKLFNFLNAIQSDLRENKINEKQFNFLLGFFLRTELNNFVNNEINSILPEQEQDNFKEMTLLTYKKNRKFTYVH